MKLASSTTTSTAGRPSALTPPTAFFAERLFRTFDALDRKQEDYQAEIDRLSDNREVFEIARARDAEMRAMVDEALGAPVCDAVFGGMNVYAVADGLPVWCNLMLAIFDLIDTTFAAEQKKTTPRIAKYTAKYQRK